MQSRVVVFSCDAMVAEDIEYLLKKERFASLAARASRVKTMKTVYPSVTYPCHASMLTGCYPEKHGVTSNMKYIPGQLKNVPWNWFADAIKTPDIFTAAKQAGLKTASVFWPVTGNHKYIDYNIPEYWPQGDGDTKRDCFLRAGTSEELWERVVAPNIENVKIRTHPDTDEFIIKCCCDILKTYKPHLLTIHTGDVDAYRHSNGLFCERVTRGVEDTERWLCDLMNAAREAGTFEETNFFLVSDHGQLEIVRKINLNVLLAENGLIDVDEAGNLRDWQAYCHSTGLSAQVMLRDPENKEIYEKTYALLNRLCGEEVYGIERVYTKEQAKNEERLAGEFSFVLESDGYTSFSEDWQRPLVISKADASDYRYGKATHGHHPEKGPQPVLFAFGPDIREGVVLERKNTVDEAPTYAKILGVKMPWADGCAIEEILK